MDWAHDIIWLAWSLGIVLALAYGFVLLFGAPYFPSLKPHMAATFDLLKLTPGQTIYDLGCGDGRLLKEAAKRGYKAVGYELNPFVFAYAWLTTRRYRKYVKVRLGNFWNADLQPADAVFVFLLDKYMPRLDRMLKSTGKHFYLASHTFKIPGKKIIAHKYGVFLYKY